MQSLPMASPTCQIIEGPVLSRFAPHAGLVTLRQTFVRRSHDGNCRCQGLKDEQWHRFSPELSALAFGCSHALAEGFKGRRTHSSLISGLLGLEGISKRKDSHCRSGRCGELAQVQGPNLCGRGRDNWNHERAGFPAHSRACTNRPAASATKPLSLMHSTARSRLRSDARTH
jgi:hypothetical protein